MHFEEIVSNVGLAVEIAGVFAIIIGGIVATVIFLRQLRHHATMAGAYRLYRRRLGQGLLLGLEFLVAGDIIRTVAATPTYYDLGILAIIVLIRTFLSVTLELEIEGRWPWQSRAETQKPDASRDSS